jgi:hypothetical protein
MGFEPIPRLRGNGFLIRRSGVRVTPGTRLLRVSCPTLGLELRSSGEAYRHRRSGSAGRICSTEWSRDQRVVTGGRPPGRVGRAIVSGNSIGGRVFRLY